MSFQLMKSTFVIFGILLLGPTSSEARQQEVQGESPAAAGDPIEILAASVRDLRLGEGVFVIGTYLTEDQIELARGKLLSDTYPGTIKFPDGDAVVVADEKTFLILAIYQRREEVRADDVKQMVGYLMTRFGEPTTMAHGKLIYWAFGKAGKIDENTYLESKATGEIDILATVKFNSTLDLDKGLDNDNMEETGTIYYIITSDRLLDSYLTDP